MTSSWVRAALVAVVVAAGVAGCVAFDDQDMSSGSTGASTGEGAGESLNDSSTGSPTESASSAAGTSEADAGATTAAAAEGDSPVGTTGASATDQAVGYPAPSGEGSAGEGSDGISGHLRKWHKVTVSLEGPQTSQEAVPNPFRDYRLDVTFTHVPSGRSVTVPGYFAADGQAGETGAEEGNVWRAHLTPDAEGEWTYQATILAGPDVAVADGAASGAPYDLGAGATGRFTVGPTDKTGADHRAKGLLQYVGKHYLRFAETGEYFLKGGTNSPENLLAYYQFDNTEDHGGFGNELTDGLHRFEPHVTDWRAGDPTWHGGEGKGIIGALNYLADVGVNSVYFLTMNAGGDGREVYPWIDYDARDRYDVSKLDQWEVVFEHMDRLGLMMHVVTQEEENDHILDDGQWGPERKLYYRELIARFGHHLAVTWNLGEESSNSDEQRQAFARFLRDLDPYDHPITVHTFPDQKRAIYSPLLGFDAFEGPSMQVAEPKDVNDETRSWYKKSANAGRPWVITADEMGRPQTGAVPDSVDPERVRLRHEGLWGNLMGGGGGIEWFFGTAHPHNDLDLEDFRSRAILWDHTRHALDFYHRFLPFHEMAQCNGLINNGEGWCFGKPGEIYAIYMKRRGPTELELGDATGSLHVRWYNPRTGGGLLPGTVTTIAGPGKADIGDPPGEHDRDWVALISRTLPEAGEPRLLPAAAAR